MNNLIKAEQIENSVFSAVEDGAFLSVGHAITLEYLTSNCSGIFPSERSWQSFIRGNFLDDDCFISGVKTSTLKKWAYPLDKYSDKFAVCIGNGLYHLVDKNCLSFEFNYKLYYDRTGNFPSAVGLFVTANIKE
jgi:hypothetical protein